jgi:hypothetical protein
MKGLETLPLKFSVISIVLLITVTVGFWQVNVFLEFNNQKNFKEDLVELKQKIDFITASNYGSIIQTNMKIINDCTFSIDIDNDKIIGNISGKLYTMDITSNITKVKLNENIIETGKVYLQKGFFKFSIYYGTPHEIKNYTIVLEDHV